MEYGYEYGYDYDWIIYLAIFAGIIGLVIKVVLPIIIARNVMRQHQRPNSLFVNPLMSPMMNPMMNMNQIVAQAFQAYFHAYNQSMQTDYVQLLSLLHQLQAAESGANLQTQRRLRQDADRTRRRLETQIAHIPASAQPEHRERLSDIVHGRVKLNASMEIVSDDP